MKKLALLAIFSISVSIVSAQLKKNEKMIGGTVALSLSKIETQGQADLKNYSLTILPQVGFALNNKWIVGGLIGYQRSKTSSFETGVFDPNRIEETTQIGLIGGFIRRHHAFKDWFGIFGQFNATLGVGQQKIEEIDENGGFYTGSNLKNSIRSYSCIVRPGLYFTPHKKIIIEALFGEFGYQSLTRKRVLEGDPEFSGRGDRYSDNDFTFSLTNTLTIGIQYKF